MTLFIFHVSFPTFAGLMLTYEREMKVQSIVYISLGKNRFFVHEIVAELPDNAKKKMKTERM